jgi:hypothetical protein
VHANPGSYRVSGQYGISGASAPVGKFMEHSNEYNWVPTPAGGDQFGVIYNDILCKIPSQSFGGTNPNNGRVNNVCIVDRISLRILFEWISNTLASYSLGNIPYRVNIVHDRQCNGAGALGTDVWETPLLSYLSYPNQDNGYRFEHIYEKKGITPALPSSSGTRGSNHMRRVVVDVDIPVDIPLEYLNTSNDGGVGNLLASNLILLFSIGVEEGELDTHGMTGSWFKTRIVGRTFFHDAY